jgi:hypothetical protein
MLYCLVTSCMVRMLLAACNILVVHVCCKAVFSIMQQLQQLYAGG